MPNSQQAARRVKKAQSANMMNRSNRSKMRTSIKKFLVSVANKNIEEAKSLFVQVQKTLDTLASKRVIASNAASRYKKRLNAKLKAIVNAK